MAKPMLFQTSHKPKWWFKSIHESKSDPAYWDDKEYHGLNLLSLVITGITHYRIKLKNKAD